MRHSANTNSIIHRNHQGADPAELCSACCLLRTVWQCSQADVRNRQLRMLLDVQRKELASVVTSQFKHEFGLIEVSRLLTGHAHHAGGRVFTHVNALGLEQRPHLLEGGDLWGVKQEAGSGCGWSVIGPCDVGLLFCCIIGCSVLSLSG